MYQERIAKPGASIEEQIYQFWQWHSTKQGLDLLEETKNKYDSPVGASIFQTWYGGERKGKRIESKSILLFVLHQKHWKKQLVIILQNYI